MPTQIELGAWSMAVRRPLVVVVATTLLVIALAIAMGVTPAPMYADPAPLNFM